MCMGVCLLSVIGSNLFSNMYDDKEKRKKTFVKNWSKVIVAVVQTLIIHAFSISLKILFIVRTKIYNNLV